MIHTVGIVAEYNPFHTGHIYQIQETKKKTGAGLFIAVMSGNFVQRGEPACIDKYSRAKAALSSGIDVVLELPYIYCIQSASAFAHGAVTILKQAGVDAISFGSECGDLENLKEIADTPVNPDHLHMSLKQGMSFPKAYGLLTSEMMPNDILAVCYLKELQNSGIEPVLIPRTTNYLNETADGPVASAMAIRRMLKDLHDVSAYTPMAEQLAKVHVPSMEQMWPYLRLFLLTAPREYLASLFLFSEGIENHLAACAAQYADWNLFLNAAVTPRYTASRIRRTLLQVLTQTTKAEVSKLPPLDYIHVLGFNEKGQKWLHDCRKKEMHIASRFADIPYPYRTMEYRASLAYASFFEEQQRRALLKQEIGGAQRVTLSSEG